jgi:hypothetical protein
MFKRAERSIQISAAGIERAVEDASFALVVGKKQY